CLLLLLALLSEDPQHSPLRSTRQTLCLLRLRQLPRCLRLPSAAPLPPCRRRRDHHQQQHFCVFASSSFSPSSSALHRSRRRFLHQSRPSSILPQCPLRRCRRLCSFCSSLSCSSQESASSLRVCSSCACSLLLVLFSSCDPQHSSSNCSCFAH